MDYTCPNPADLANVYALNREFLRLAAAASAADGNERWQHVKGLSATVCERLSRSPFLLYTLIERDPALWERLFVREPDLLDQPTHARWVPLTTATLAFLWHLSKRNPHSARLFAGCPPRWCEHLAERRLVCITNRALDAGVSPVPRELEGSHSWSQLVKSATRSEASLSRTGRIQTMQRVLLQRQEPANRVLSSAACRIRPPGKTTA